MQIKAIRRETELSLHEAAEYVGRSYETVRQWTKYGRNGVILESWMKGGQVATSQQAIERFFEILSAKRRETSPLIRALARQQQPTAAALAAQKAVLEGRA